MCSLDDIEVTVKDVHEVYTVDANGQIEDFKETYAMESYAAYYSCSCGEDWTIGDNQQYTWAKVKEHISDN